MRLAALALVPWIAMAEVASANPQARIAVGAGQGSPPRVVVYDGDMPTFDFNAYGASFMGGVRVALGDLNGDGVADLVTAPAAGTGQRVNVYDGVTGVESWYVYPFTIYHTAGIFIAAGDVNGDGLADVVTGSDADAGPNGGPHVKVFDGATHALIHDFNAFDTSFRGGVRVAVGDVNGDGFGDVIVGSGVGGGGHVKIQSGLDLAPLGDFFAYGPSFTGGVFVAAGDLDGDGSAEIVVGPEDAGTPTDVITFDTQGNPIANVGFGDLFDGDARVATGFIDTDGLADLLFGPGPTPPPSGPLFARGAAAGPTLRRMRGYDQMDLGDLEVFDASFTGGVFVAAASVPEPHGGAALAIGLCFALRSRSGGRIASH